MSDNSLLNKKLDPYGTLWKKKYILLLKRTEGIEKLNLRLVNRLNQLKKISKNLQKERCFLMKRLAIYNDSYREARFFENIEFLAEGYSENKTPIVTSSIPKKPLNAFIRYCQEIRDEVDEQNPGISRQDLTKVISYKWNAMSSSDKEIYFDLFDKDKQRYEEEMKQYTQQIAQQNTEKTGNLMNIDFKNSGSSRSSKIENISLSSSNNGLSFDDDNNAST
ncbi:high mobility group-T protein isoform X2 [Hydra vulgaris]|uniref:high mobility group-T protein isoform X2 n=1 Tax=Hydra vulgaris TaxID=6087 RepID=UPI0002B4A861|nr:high mobility group-T protein-like isoform X1 [Hydra vulgaris]